MTTFESILLLAVTACVIITAFGVLVIKKMLQEIIDRKDANWEQLRKIETHTNFLADISQQLDNIENSNDQDFEKLTDTVNKMHRNLCAIIAEKMVERTFPIKKGQPLDAAFEPEVAELKRSKDVYAECRKMDAVNTASVCENMTKIQKELQKKGGQDGN